MRMHAALAIACAVGCKDPARAPSAAAPPRKDSTIGASEELPPAIEQDVKAIAQAEHATAQRGKGTIRLVRAWRYASGPVLAPGRSWVAIETDFGSLAIDTDDLEVIDPATKATAAIGDVRRLDASGNVTSFGGANSNDSHYVLFFDVSASAKSLELTYWGETLSTAPVAIADTGPAYAEASRTVIRHFARSKRDVILIEDHNQADPPSSITEHLTAGKQECALTGMIPVTASLAPAEPSTEPIISHAFYLADYICQAPPDAYGVTGVGKPIPAAEKLALPAPTLEALEGRGDGITLLPAQQVFTHVAATRDGTLLAIAPYDSAVRLVDAQGKERAKLAGLSTSEMCGLGFTPDGKRAWSVQQDGLVLLWDVASGKQLAKTTIDPPPDLYSHPSLTPDGRFLLVDHPWDDPQNRVAWSGQLEVLSLPDLARKGTIRIVKGDKGSLKNLALAADGKTLLACATSEDAAIVKTYALPAGTPLSTIKTPPMSLAACILTTDDRVVLGAESGDLHVYDRTGKQLGTASAHRGGTYALHAREDGTFVSGGADGVVLAWPARGDKLAPQTVARHKYPVVGLDTLGSLVVSTSSNEVLVTDGKTHARLQRLHGSPDGPESVAVAPGMIAVSEMMMDGKSGRVRIWHPPPK